MPVNALRIGFVLSLTTFGAACSGGGSNVALDSSLAGATAGGSRSSSRNSGGIAGAVQSDFAGGGANATSSAGGNLARGGANATGNTGGGANASGNTGGGANATGNSGGNFARGGVSASGSAGATSATSDPGSCRVEGDGKTTLVFVNDCAQQVVFRGSDIAGGVIEPKNFVCVDVGTASETISSKRYWGWVGADPGSGRHTLAEFTFNTDFYDLDWYNISHVDAHNLPMAIRPAARPKCRALSCPQDFLATCPTEGQFRDTAGRLVSCVSPDRDDPKSSVVQSFEQCDDAYAWSGDDASGSDPSPMVGCAVEDFDIVFCPKAP